MSMDFVTFARLHDVEINDLTPSSRIQRCGTTDHPKSRNGAFLYDGNRGWVQNWGQGGEIEWWDNPDRREPTAEDRADWARKRAETERLQRLHWSEGARKAQALMDTAVVGEHDYLHRKGLGDIQGLVVPERRLFVPMWGLADGDLVGCQLIFWDDETREWRKKYQYGSRPRGAALRLGPEKTNEVVLCEGYATGLTIDKALRAMRLRASVLVCFNDSNMTHVAELLAGKVARTYVFADHDESGAGEKAARETGLRYAMSDRVGEDANDLMVRAGLMPVMAKLFEARKLVGIGSTVCNTQEQ